MYTARTPKLRKREKPPQITHPGDDESVFQVRVWPDRLVRRHVGQEDHPEAGEEHVLDLYVLRHAVRQLPGPRVQRRGHGRRVDRRQLRRADRAGLRVGRRVDDDGPRDPLRRSRRRQPARLGPDQRTLDEFLVDTVGLDSRIDAVHQLADRFVRV